MIVQCVGCQTHLRVDESKIPAEGGLKMRCPKCSAVFRVRPSAKKPQVIASTPEPLFSPASGAERLSSSSTRRVGTAIFGIGNSETISQPKSAESDFQRSTAIFGAPDASAGSDASRSSPGGTAIFGNAAQSGSGDSVRKPAGTAIFGAGNEMSDFSLAFGESEESDASVSASESNPSSAEQPEQNGGFSTENSLKNADSSGETPSLVNSNAAQPGAGSAPEPEEIDDSMIDEGAFRSFEQESDFSKAFGDAHGHSEEEAAQQKPAADAEKSSSTVQPEAAPVQEMDAGKNFPAGSAEGAANGASPAAAEVPKKSAEPEKSADGESSEEVFPSSAEGLLSGTSSQREKTAFRKRREARKSVAVGVIIVILAAACAAFVTWYPPAQKAASSVFTAIVSALGRSPWEAMSIHRPRWVRATTASGKKIMILNCGMRNNGTMAVKVRPVRVTMMRDGNAVASSIAMTGISITQEDLLDAALQDETSLAAFLERKAAEAPALVPGEAVPTSVVFFEDSDKISEASIAIDWNGWNQAGH